MGDSAIRHFWWPNDGSHTRATSYTTIIEEIGGTSALAYARGTGLLRFAYQRDTTRVQQLNHNMTLTIVTRQLDGRWRILRRLWRDLEPPQQPAADEPSRTGTIDVVDLLGTAAMAKATLRHGGTTFTDYFVLIRAGDKWLIASNVYHARR